MKLSCWLFNTKIVLIRHSFKNHYKSIWKRHESRVKGQKLLHTLSSQQVHEEVLIYMYSTVLLYIPRTSKNLSTHFRVYCRITSKVKKCCLYVEKLRLLYMKQDINTEKTFLQQQQEQIIYFYSTNEMKMIVFPCRRMK